MTGDPPPIAPEPAPIAFDAPPAPTAARPRAARWPWWLALLCLVLGAAASAYLLPRAKRWWSPPAAVQPVVQLPAATPSSPAPAAAMPITLEGLAAREMALDSQLRAIEARMAAADAASRTAAGNAMRAERLLIATAARRELNRGLPLGPLENQLRSRFGADQSQAVAVVIAAGRSPVTLEDLRHALNTIAPTLASGSTRDGIVKSIRREMSNLIVLRRDSIPSPRPADRLDRARRMIDAGNVEGALGEVSRMPGAADAMSWIDAAKRYVEARRALNQLELAALNGGGPTPAGPATPIAPAAPVPEPAPEAPAPTP